MLLESLHVQIAREGVREEVALAQPTVVNFYMCLIDREDSQLVVPGGDLHGVREGGTGRVPDVFEPILDGQVDPFKKGAFVEGVTLCIELLPGVEVEALDVFQDSKGPASLADAGGSEAECGSVVRHPAHCE
eukprot:16432383-Heterocapsa_arctica.AAC.2